MIPSALIMMILILLLNVIVCSTMALLAGLVNCKACPFSIYFHFDNMSYNCGFQITVFGFFFIAGKYIR